MADKRPENCRNRLSEEGKAHPRTGCRVSGCGGVLNPKCESLQPDGDEVVISRQSLKDLLLLAKDYTSRRNFSQEAYDRFAAAVAEGKEKLGSKL